MLSGLESGKFKANWYSHLKGIVSLGGAIWATTASEQSVMEGKGYNLLLKAFDEIDQIADKEFLNKDTLQPALVKMLAALEKAGNAYNKIFDGIKVEGVNTPIPVNDDYLSILNSLKKILSKSSKASFAGEQASSDDKLTNEILKILNLKHHLYDGKIFLKIKRLIVNFRNKIVEGQLDVRKKWFSENTLPTHLRYVSIGATFADPYSFKLEDGSNSSLEKKAYYYFDFYDHKLQRSSNYELYHKYGFRLGDGSTNFHHNLFLPRKHMKLNSMQSYYKAENIALLASDHIGLIMGSTAKNKNDAVNHFPRIPMMKALANYLSN